MATKKDTILFVTTSFMTIFVTKLRVANEIFSFLVAILDIYLTIYLFI